RSGADAIGHAFRLVASGRRRWVLAGGADSMINPLGVAGFCKIHSFPFSPRQQTAAARWTDQFVPGTVVRRRIDELRSVEAELARRFEQQCLDTVERVLVERRGGHLPADSGLLCGRCDRYFRVYFQADPGGRLRPGDIAWVRIDRVSPRRVHGTLLGAPSLDRPLPVLAGDGC
ncbi:MAG: TRAM domain-containing protein, partial [bacterium]|nr:TRAM domain-containing protein [bacterium]